MRGWHKGLTWPKGTYAAQMPGWSQGDSEVGLRWAQGGGGEGGLQLEGPKGDLDLPPKVCYGTDDMCPRHCGKGLDQGDVWPKRGGLERRGGEKGWGGEAL